ncbi:hypothetical protein NC652_002684 [Populus alba x Populus x berolinensis]|nr:hypothetical protein NC652_002684 [Populus alba x Populus x berolinensis]
MIIQKQNGWGHAHGSGWWLSVVQRAQLELAGHSWQNPASKIWQSRHHSLLCMHTNRQQGKKTKQKALSLSLSLPNPPAAFLLLPILPSPSCFIPEVRPSFMATEDAGLASWNWPFGSLVEDY